MAQIALGLFISYAFLSQKGMDGKVTGLSSGDEERCYLFLKKPQTNTTTTPSPDQKKTQTKHPDKRTSYIVLSSSFFFSPLSPCCCCERPVCIAK